MNPYFNLPKHQYWKSGVSDVKGLVDIEVFQKKWTIEKNEKIMTAGSCFAQHIGRELKALNFNVMDVERAPVNLPQSESLDYGYGMYSARYGNIYTVRQLLQLLKESIGLITPKDFVWIDGDGQYRDAFRPNIEPKGDYFSIDVITKRALHLNKVRYLFENLDILVFTFGLTESWINNEESLIYPTAPGTICGKYVLGGRYSFKNFTYLEVLEDFLEFKKLLESINPKKIKYLLTVSPVPLTATAVPQHVLLSTTYSKAVLRSVVGDLANRFSEIDYFPSYEIISNPYSAQIYYEKNLRSVTSAGVANVMSVFKSHFVAFTTPVSVQDKSGANSVIDAGKKVICEDALLDSFAQGSDK